MHSTGKRLPYLGFGLGFRKEHYQTILEEKPSIDWLEALSENYLVPGGKPLHYLDRIREHYPLVLHGVSLSIGGADPLDKSYLSQLKALVQRVEPCWVSDHLCWTGLDGINAHDLLPLPYTEEAVHHVAERVIQVQDWLGRRILLENVSSYLCYRDSRMSEWEFLTAVAETADCLILLDINNIHVSAVNHGFDPESYLDGVLPERVQQFHLAGHTNYGSHIIDTHDAAIVDAVWALYEKALRRFGDVSCMIERDDKIPSLQTLLDELQCARRIAEPVREAAELA